MRVALSSYYALISVVMFQRMSEWGRAIEEIIRELQGDLTVLQGFSPSNIKYMRQFFGERENFQGDNILAIKGSQLGVDKSLVKNSIRSIRQLPIGELTNADINAFLEIGFTHHIQVFSFCRIQFVD